MTALLEILEKIATTQPAIVAVVIVVMLFLGFMYMQGRDQKEDRQAMRGVMQDLNLTLKETAQERGASRVQSEQMVDALNALREDRTDLRTITHETTSALKDCTKALQESSVVVRESQHELTRARKVLERTHA